MAFRKKGRPKEPLTRGTDYFVEGEKVPFMRGDTDFMFGRFCLTLTEEKLLIRIEDEAPMNILNISGVVHLDIEPDRKEIMEADTANITLRLKPGVFAKYREELLRQTDPVSLFGFAADGGYPVRNLKNWVMSGYRTKVEWEA